MLKKFLTYNDIIFFVTYFIDIYRNISQGTFRTLKKSAYSLKFKFLLRIKLLKKDIITS